MNTIFILIIIHINNDNLFHFPPESPPETKMDRKKIKYGILFIILYRFVICIIVFLNRNILYV